jgi:Tfp pilus assembly protein FimT
MTANPHKNTLLQVAQGIALTKTCKRVFLFSTQEKLKIKKIPSLQKNKTSQPHNQRQTSILTVCSLTTTDCATTERRRASANKGLKEMAGEVRKQRVVLLINSSGRLTVCASKPPLL